MRTPYSTEVRRAALPEVMFTPDISLALQLSPTAARRAVVRGECGPFLRIGNRIAVLRESFLAVLGRRQTVPTSDHREGARHE